MFSSHILEETIYAGTNSIVYGHGGSYIDFTSGIFALNIGWANRAVTKAIVDRAYFLHTYTYETNIRKKYIKKLCDFTGFESAALFSSGTEATEAAWRIVRKFTMKNRITGLGPDSFHGKTLGAQIMAEKVEDWRNQFHPHETGAIIMEPYVAHRAQFHPPELIAKINGMIERHELMLILDEIQAGFGRTGKLFGYQHYLNKIKILEAQAPGLEPVFQEQETLKPDLVCIGKGMGNGFPLSGVLGASKYIDDEAFELSSTHGGNPLACAVGIAVIDYMLENNVISESARKGSVLHKKLADFEVPTFGRGMVAALEFGSTKQADEVVVAAARNGLLVVHTGRETVKLGPPLTIPDEQLEEGIEILKNSVEEVLNGN